MMQSMTEIQRSAFRHCRPTLARDMMTRELLEQLVARDAITDDDEERVLHETTTKDKNEMLLKLLRSKPPDVFDKLVVSLEEIGQPHLAALLVNKIRSGASGRLRGRSISEIGNLLTAGGVPLEPEVYIERQELTQQIRDAIIVIAKSKRPGWALVHGMGGIGKTTLVSQALREPSFIEYFPNGVVWFKVGQLETNEVLLIRMNMLLARLAIDRAAVHSSNLDEAHLRLRSALLEERPRTLLILDDLWDDRMARWFSVGAQAVVVTSRNADVLDRVQGHVEKVPISSGLTQGQSDSVFSRTLGVNASDLPGQAESLWKECGGSPLAISMLAALLKKSNSNRWGFYLQMLKKHRLEKVKSKSDYEYETLDRAIDISIENLPEEQQERYRRLSVFQRGVLLSPRVLATLWDIEEIEEAEDEMGEFVVRSLAWREWNEEQERDMFGVHDLQHSRLRALADKEEGTKKHYHQELLNRYQAKCEAGKWANLPRDDGYIFWFIAMHLYGAGLRQELVRLLTDLEFLAAKLSVTGPTDVVNDFIIYEKLFVEAKWETERETYLSFVRRHANLWVGSVEELRGKVVQLGLCQERKSVVFQDALRLAKERCRNEGPFWLWRNTEMAPTNVLFSAKIGSAFLHSVDVNRDGSMVLVSNNDGQVFLLSATSGQEVCSFQLDDSEVYRAAFLGGGDRFVCCSDSGFIRILEVPHVVKERPCRMGSGGDGVDHCLHGGPMVPLSERRATAEEAAKEAMKAVFPRGDVPLDQTPPLTPKLSSEPQLQARCCCMGDNVIFVGCQDGTLARYSLLEGEIYFSSEIPAHKEAIMAVALSDCGLFVVTASVDRRGRIYDLEELEFMSTYRDHSASLTACVMVPGQAKNAVTAAANEIHVWQIEDATCVSKLEGPRNVTFMSLAISVDAKYLAAGMSNNAITLFNFHQKERLWEFWGHKGSPLSLCFYKDDQQRQRLMSVADDATLIAWDLSMESGTYKRLEQLTLQVKPSLAVHWSAKPGQGTLVAAQDSHSGRLLLLRHQMGTNKCDVLYNSSAEPQRAQLLAFTADGGRLAVGFEAGSVLQMEVRHVDSNAVDVKTLQRWSAAKGVAVDQVDLSVSCLRFLGQTEMLVVGLADGQVWLLPSEGEARQLGQHEKRVSVLVQHKDCLLSASYDCHVRRWSIAGADEGETVCVASDSILSMDVLPDKQWLVTAHSDNNVQLWVMSAHGPASLLRDFSGHDHCVRVARFCPSDPGLIATADDGGNVLVWRAPNGDVMRKLTRANTDADTEWINDLVWTGSEHLLSVSASIRAWHVASGRLLQTFHPRGSKVVQVSTRPGHGLGEMVAVDSAGTLYLLESVKPGEE